MRSAWGRSAMGGVGGGGGAAFAYGCGAGRSARGNESGRRQREYGRLRRREARGRVACGTGLLREGPDASGAGRRHAQPRGGTVRDEGPARGRSARSNGSRAG